LLCYFWKGFHPGPFSGLIHWLCHQITGADMKRRDVLALIGAAATALASAARAQQAGPVRRVGVLLPATANDPDYEARVNALVQGLASLGWSMGRNLRIDVRWATGDPERFRQYAEELAGLGPDVLLASSSLAVAALQQATRTVPIVFGAVVDPVGSGFVASLARPGGNTTGFTNFEYGLSGKWLELLKEIKPALMRAAILKDDASQAERGMFAVMQSAAPSLGVELKPVGMHDAGEIEKSVTAFAGAPNGGLIVLGSALASVHRDLIIGLARQYRLPAVYSDRLFVAGGGLMCYGPDRVDQFRRAAVYVDRILKGEKPADLPVQAPTKYELVINLKAAKAVGMTLPPTLLARADEVIE
jgi:putative ABC transport system substrate-binding protein